MFDMLISTYPYINGEDDAYSLFVFPIFIVRYSLDLSTTCKLRCLLKTRNFQQRKYLNISYTLSNDIKIMLSLFFYIRKENVHQLGWNWAIESEKKFEQN